MSESNHWSKIDNYLLNRAVNLCRVITEKLWLWKIEALALLMEQTENILKGQQTCLLCQMFGMVADGATTDVAVVILSGAYSFT